ncbi:MAG: DsrH/TusB family sulfur metabolism protein [Candidatus Hydrothermarchaeales archaeon]
MIEVFRNIPPGKPCSTLTKNVMDVVSEKGIDYEIDKELNITTYDFEVKLLPFPSKDAEERGITKAPAISINKKFNAYGVLSVDEIKELIEKARPLKLGVIITKTPNASEDVENALSLGEDALTLGNQVGIFLLSDGIWVAKKGQPLIEKRLSNLIERGCKVAASKQHLKAAGLSPEKLIEDVKVSDEPYDELVDLVMEEWDKVIIF